MGAALDEDIPPTSTTHPVPMHHLSFYPATLLPSRVVLWGLIIRQRIIFFSTMIQHPILNRLVYGGHHPRPTSYSYHPFDNITLFIISTETSTPTSQLYSTFRLQVAAKLFTFSAPCSHNNHLPFSAPSSHTSQSQFTLFMGAIVLSSVFFESRYLFP
jgi:hypothetical protein